MRRAIAKSLGGILLLLVLTVSTAVSATEVERPPTLAPGELRASAAGGAAKLDRNWTWTADASIRGGLPLGFELSAPLAVGYSLVQTENGSGWSVGGGVTDLWVNESGTLLWTPSILTVAHFRVAQTASVHTALDFTWIEEGFGADAHPAWLRGSAALVVSMGPYLTWAFGMAYQHIVIGERAPLGADQAGFAGNARVSIGAVRSEGFEDIPTFAIHASPVLDIIILLRMDIDTDVDTTDSRFLAGIRVKLNLTTTDTTR